MAFLGGPECSTAANPLSQFTKHVQDDTSLQRDRLVDRAHDRVADTFRTRPAGGTQDAMFDNFMRAGSPMLPINAAPPSFAMDTMKRELENVQHRSSSPSYKLYSGANLQHTNQQSSTGMSPADFARFTQHTGQSASSRPSSALNQVSRQAPSYQPSMGTMYSNMSMGTGMNMGMGMAGMGYMPASQSFMQQRPQSQSTSVEPKGKARMVELDDKEWESQFAQLDSQDAQGADEQGVETNMATETDHTGDFESIWKGIQAETAANAEAMEQAGIHNTDARLAHDDLDRWRDFDGLSDGQDMTAIGTYLFERDNPFRESSITDPFSEGQKIMAEGGNLSLAALAFETAVQRDPTHVSAWVALGQAQAQNEKETPAVRALEEALKLDPACLEAMMALAVSYTNEGYETTAYRTLERWVTTKYPHLATSNTNTKDSTSNPSASNLEETWSWMDRDAQCARVTDLFIRAAQLSPSGEGMDPDVQVGLGVLFYAAEEFDKAVDCFGAALASTVSGSTNSSTQLHLLWNRLGAVLANSGRSEEALDAYERALELRPNFVRARYNLGVSCINMGCYEQAARHLLGALACHRVVEREGLERVREVIGAQQQGGVETGAQGAQGEQRRIETMIRQNESTNLFDTLRRVFSQLGRRDLVDMVGPGMDLGVFRQEGFLET